MMEPTQNSALQEFDIDVELARPDPSQDVQVGYWGVAGRHGQDFAVPPSLRSLCTFVLLEQEGWFEPEMSLLPHLLAGGVHALDIGANHGLVALEMARCSGTGQVWAFEPTKAPRHALRRSVQVNGLQHRVTVVACALGDAQGRAIFELRDNSELNARLGNSPLPSQSLRTETVRVEALDHALQALRVEQPIGFVKIDAEGDEQKVMAGGKDFFASHSPVVMFEVKHGRLVNLDLVKAWRELGFGIFRWSPELELLLPFDEASAELGSVLNLLALRPAQQQVWAERGLLVTAQAMAVAELPPLPTQTPGYEAAFAAVQLARAAPPGQAQALSPAQRALLMVYALQQLLHATAVGAGASTNTQVTGQAASAGQPGAGSEAAAWVLLVHCLNALGQPQAALEMGQQLMSKLPPEHWGPGVPADALPPLRAQDHQPCTTERGPWLRQMLAEYVAMHSAFSSYFEAPSPRRWESLLAHPDHSADVERRYLLSLVMADEQPAPQHLQRLTHLPRLQAGGPGNPHLWLGLIKSMHGVTASAPQP